jgi:uncharacterized protein (TIGR00297 family)
MHTRDLLILLLLIIAAAASAIRKKLTPPAAGMGVILGTLIYAGSGYMGLTLLAAFFIAGTAATSWKKNEKLGIKGSSVHQTMRHTGQVLANAAVAAILCGMALLLPQYKSLLLLMMAASLASAMSDTLSSELGMVYGRRCYHILTWRPDERGLDGVISIEGLLFGIAGSALLAAVYSLLTATGPRPFFLIVIAGTLGNLADSVLGALFERRGRLSNNLVNFLNTLFAACFAGALA